MKEKQNIYEESNKKKQLIIFKRLLDRDSKLYKMIENREISENDMYNILKSASVATIFNRSLCSSSIHTTLIFNNSKKAKEQILREQKRREISALSYSQNMRKYFKKRLIFGRTKTTETSAIVSEILKMIKSIIFNANDNIYFKANGIDLEELIVKLVKKKDNYIKIIESRINGCDNEIIKARLIGILNRSISNIDRVNNDVFAIENLYRRKYLPLKIKKEKRNKP